MTEYRGPQDLTLLLEQHQKEIWEWKQKESQWVRDKNQLDGNKQIIEELSTKMIELGKINLSLQAKVNEFKSSRSLSSMDEVAYRELEAKVNELEGTLGSAQGINDNHQRYNGKLQTRLTEVEEDNKKLAKQIEHMNTRVWGGH